MKQKLIFIVISLSMIMGSPSCGFAESKGYPIDPETIKSKISANHALTTRFSLQQAALSKKTAPSTVDKAKLTALSNKIAVLKNDNEHLVALLSGSVLSKGAPAVAQKDLTGKDWISMRAENKELYIFSTLGALVKKDVLTLKPSNYYIESLNKVIAHNVKFESTGLDDLLILIIYKYEPDTRVAINTFRKVTNAELQPLESL